MGESSSPLVITLPNVCGRQNRTFLICYVTSCDYVIKCYMTFVWEPLTLIDQYAKFDAFMDLLEVEI